MWPGSSWATTSPASCSPSRAHRVSGLSAADLRWPRNTPAYLFLSTSAPVRPSLVPQGGRTQPSITKGERDVNEQDVQAKWHKVIQRRSFLKGVGIATAMVPAGGSLATGVKAAGA